MSFPGHTAKITSHGTNHTASHADTVAFGVQTPTSTNQTALHYAIAYKIPEVGLEPTQVFRPTGF